MSEKIDSIPVRFTNENLSQTRKDGQAAQLSGRVDSRQPPYESSAKCAPEAERERLNINDN